MLPGIAAPWMLPWLGAVGLPILLMLAAVAHPRVRRFAPIDLLLRAAGRAHVTRRGIAWPEAILRCLLVAAAALAAARPFVKTGAAPAAGLRGASLVAGSPLRRIAIVAPSGMVDEPGASPAPAAALAGAIEALAEAPPRRAGGGGRAAAPPTVDFVPLGAASRAAAAVQLLILPDGAVPGPAEAARLGAAVDDGLSVLVCLGPESLHEDMRGRTSAWLESLLGSRAEGVLRLDDAAIELAGGLAATLGVSPAVAGSEAIPDGADGGTAIAGAVAPFFTLPGPAVTAAALVAPISGAILARTAPDGIPLVWSARRGRGRACVSALPLALPSRRTEPATADDSWSDLAAWPVFVPLVAALLEEACPGVLAGGDVRPQSVAVARPAGDGRLPLAPLLVALAILLAVADWLRGRGATAPVAADGLRLLRGCGRVAAVAVLVAMLAAWSAPPVASGDKGAARSTVAVVVDVSPSMEGPAVAGAPLGATRLDAVRAALRGTGDEGVLGRLARDCDVALCTAADRLDRVAAGDASTLAAAVDRLRGVASAPAASRLGDAVLELLDTGASGAAADAIVVISDGVITAGAAWDTAATAAATRDVAVVTVPVGAAVDAAAVPSGRLPPGFRLTRLVAPKLGRPDDPVAIMIEAEAAIDGAVPVALHAGPQDGGPPLATGTLAPRASGPTGTGRLTGTLVVPPRAFAALGTRQLSPRIVAGGGDDAVTATVPLVVTDAAVEVVLVESGPRFEWRFLERLLAADAAFAPRTVMLSGTAAQGVPDAAALPRTPREWSRCDVAVIGDVPFGDYADGGASPVASAAAAPVTAAGLADALEALGVAAARDGLGIVWLPGPRWRESPGDGPAWLPLRAAAAAANAADVPLRLRPLAAGRDADWLPWSGPGDPFAPEVFATAGPVVLGPTARVLAVAAVAGDTIGSARRGPAIVLDRRDSAHVLVHLCETWRWRRTDVARYRGSWRRNLLRLAEPHLLGRLLSATLAVEPPAPAAGDAVRILVTPTRSSTDLTGWSLVVSAEGRTAEGAAAADRAAEVVHPLGTAQSPRGRPATVDLGGLAAGTHVVRLVPPGGAAADPAAAARHPVHTLVVGARRIERPGDPAGTAALEAATVAVGGAVVPLDRLAGLPEAIQAAIQRASGRSDTQPGSGGPAAPGRGGLATGRDQRPFSAGGNRGRARGLPTVFDHWLMGLLVASLTAAWWPAGAVPLGGGGTDARD